MEGFFPSYPKTDDEFFREKIYAKYEFREVLEKENDKAYPHQEIIWRYFRPHTGYDACLLYHETGTGKTKASIGVASYYKGIMKRAIILVTGDPVGMAFDAEIENIYGKKPHFFETKHHESFGSQISRMTDMEIREQFNESVIIIDEAHHLRTTTDAKKTYNYLHRFLHVVEGCKILVLTATPMADNGPEIASIMNLILPLDMQMSVEDVRFYLMKENKHLAEDYFKKYFNGRVSYVAKSSTIGEIRYQGEEVSVKFDGEPITLKTKLTLHEMSSHQESYYYSRDPDFSGESTKDNRTNKTFALKARDALNFAPPQITDKVTGKTYSSVADYLDVSADVMRFKKVGNFNLEAELKDIEKMKIYSAKYASIIERAKNSKDCTYIYLPYIETGIYPLAVCLRAQGYTYYDGNTVLEPIIGIAKRFTIITSRTRLQAIENIKRIFNWSGNKYGEFLQIVIGSKHSSESLDFLNVREVDIVQPEWNSSSKTQAEGRAMRSISLRAFRPEERYINVYNHASVAYDEDGELVFTKDIELHLRSEDKQEEIDFVANFLKRYAFDAYLNAERNKLDINLPDVKIDYSSYIMFYDYPSMIYEIQEEIARRFNISFEIKLQDIYDTLPYDKNLILVAVVKLLESNMTVSNRFGLKCYVRRYGDTLYLQLNSSVGNIKESEMNAIYSNLFLIAHKDYLSYSIKIAQKSKEFDSIFKSKEITYDILNMSVDKRSILLEEAITKEIPRKHEILDILKNVWFVFSDGVIVHTAKEDAKYLMSGTTDWKIIPYSERKKNKYIIMIKDYLKKAEEDFVKDDNYTIFTCDSGKFRLKTREEIRKVGNVCTAIKPDDIIKHVMGMRLKVSTRTISEREFKAFKKEFKETSERKAKYYYFWRDIEDQGSKVKMCDVLMKISIEQNKIFIM